MKISEVSQISRISIDTLRYYEKIDLLNPKRIGSHRVYQDSDLETLKFIQILKESTFSLNEIHMLIKMDQQYLTMDSVFQMHPSDIQSLRSLLSTKLSHIDQKIATLLDAQQLIGVMNEKINQLPNGDINDESNI